MHLARSVDVTIRLRFRRRDHPTSDWSPARLYPRSVAALVKRAPLVFHISLYLAFVLLVYREWLVPERGAGEARVASLASDSSRAYVVHTQEGLARYQRGELALAEVSFRVALDHAPDDALAVNNLGSVLVAQGRLDEAIRLLEWALELDSTLVIARNNLAWARLKQQQRAN